MPTNQIAGARSTRCAANMPGNNPVITAHIKSRKYASGQRHGGVVDRGIGQPPAGAEKECRCRISSRERTTLAVEAFSRSTAHISGTSANQARNHYSKSGNARMSRPAASSSQQQRFSTTGRAFSGARDCHSRSILTFPAPVRI